jgi:hypothetical protein
MDCYDHTVCLPKGIRSRRVRCDEVAAGIQCQALSYEGINLQKGETMKLLRIVGLLAPLVLCVGMAAAQDAAHDVNKGAAKTAQAVKHTGKKVGNATKSGAKGAGNGTKVVAKDSAKGVKKATEKTGAGIKDAAGK